MIVSKLRSRAGGLVLLAFLAFISLGLPDGLLGVAWPSIRADFGLPLDALGLWLLSSMLGYLASSFFSGRLVARLGVGRLLAASCALTSLSLLGYTLAPSWWLLVLLGVSAGMGGGAIDAGLNAYIAAHHGEGMMQWLHAFFGVGVTLGPIIMTAGLDAFGQWRWGYRTVGLAQIILAAAFSLTAARWQSGSAQKPQAGSAPRLTDYQTSLRATLRQPRAWLSMLMFFLYVGVELAFGHWGYSLLTESRRVAPELAGLVIGSYWGMFTIGRVLAGLFARRLGSDRLLRGGLVFALAGTGLLWWNPSQLISVAGVVIVGIAIAPIFPALMSGTAARVGPQHAANTIGMEISAAGLGGPILSGLAGAVARRTSLEMIPPYLALLIIVLLGLYLLSLPRPGAFLATKTHGEFESAVTVVPEPADEEPRG